MIQQVAIIGVGLIGSSLGLAFKEITDINKVLGIDANPQHLQQALDIGAIDDRVDLATGVQQADLVILAVPVGLVRDLALEVKPYLNEETIVTDVGSTKVGLVTELETMLPTYIGGHPMAGSELSGPSGADKYLFENAMYVLTKTENTNQQALTKLQNLVEKIGAQSLVIEPQVHDQIVGVTSHLPHLVAVSLMEAITDYSQESELLTSLIGGGFKDTTRIAAGAPRMWKDIFLHNQEEVLAAIDVFLENVKEFQDLIATEAEAELESRLAAVKEARQSIPMHKKGLLPTNYELILTLEDKPNAIGQVATLLGEAKINIQDIEVLKVRDDGGTIRLSFKQQQEQETAYKLLQQNNYKVVKK
ncbi:prephenate dehydrogenase/arogenate dehydrogenase family protein [Halanaerobaculum tunisiense]